MYGKPKCILNVWDQEKTHRQTHMFRRLFVDFYSNEMAIMDQRDRNQ